MVHILGLFGARPATVPHPFLLLALYHGPPRSAAVITPTPLPSVSPAQCLALSILHFQQEFRSIRHVQRFGGGQGGGPVGLPPPLLHGRLGGGGRLSGDVDGVGGGAGARRDAAPSAMPFLVLEPTEGQGRDHVSRLTHNYVMNL